MSKPKQPQIIKYFVKKLIISMKGIEPLTSRIGI
jgi:hypothetical protein